MQPKERRERLFGGEKPFIRPLADEDMKWLYGAYKYPEPPGDNEDFQKALAYLTKGLSRFQLFFIADDRNAKFKEGRGPVGMASAFYNGWTVEPHVYWFPWATRANRVRVSVAFFMFCRYNSEFGCTEIRALDKGFFKKLKQYCPIYYVNKIPGGDPRGDLHLFYIRGRKTANG